MLVNYFFPIKFKSWDWLRLLPIVYISGGVLFCAILDVLSWLGWLYPELGNIFVVVLSLIWLAVVVYSLPAAVGLLLAELVIGSLGHNFNFVWQSYSLPWRYILFILAVAWMVLQLWDKRQLRQLDKKEWYWFGLMGAAIFYGLLVGWWRHNGFSNIFLDVNGYLYLLLWPLFWLVSRQSNWFRTIRFILLPAVLWLAFKTIFTFYLFSHYPSADLWLYYRWWRDTGFGEITLLRGNYYRIFSQSQLWSGAAFLAGLVYWLKIPSGLKQFWHQRLTTGGFLLLNLMAVLISLSRSLWLGLAVGLVWLFYWVGRSWGWRRVGNLLVSLVGLLLLSWLGIQVILRWPWPPVNPNLVQGTLLDRFSQDEAAGISRLQLLGPLWQGIVQHSLSGNGFGSMITYHTSDPRIVSSTAGGSGIVSTFAFEWGFLDLWYKLGLLAMFIFLIFFLRLLWLFILQNRNKPVSLNSLLASLPLIFVLVTNLTTPYLNHPLGLGILMLVLALTIYQPSSVDYV